MGIYDRDYERGYGNGGYGGGGYGGGGWQPEGQGGIQLRMPTTAVGWVLVTTIVTYLVTLPFTEKLDGGMFRNPVIDFFHLESDWYLRPWRIYGLLTYGLMHDPLNLMHIAGNMFGFWLFGRELERRFGTREFLLFYVTAILAGGLAFTLGQSLSGQSGFAIGASAGTVAVTILFALLYPNVRILFMLVIPMPMWVLGAIIVGGDVLGALGGSGARVAFAAHLGGALFAFLYFKQRWRLSEIVPTGFELPSLKRRPKLRVHHEEFDDEEEDEEDALEKEVDRILAKIKSSGQDSLTRKEQRTLAKASRVARQRRT